MAVNEHEEAELYKAFLEKSDCRLVTPAKNNAPTVSFKWNGGWRECRIWEGYLQASKILLREIIENHPRQNELIFPALFNLRHGVEVALKWHIQYVGGTLPPNAGHNLILLVDVFCHTADELDEKDSYLSYYPLNWIGEIANIDPHAIAFRYSTSRNGTDIDINPKEWDLWNIYFIADSLSFWFDNLSNDIELSRNEDYQTYMRS